MSEQNSYRQILRSSSIIGGAQAINYVISLVRIKVVAVLLGPTGVGLVGLYMSATSLIGSATSLGLSGSGVREVSLAYSRDDPERAARAITILRRACWVTGFLGWLVAVALAVPLSKWMTGTSAHALAISMLGGTLVLGAIGGGQMAVLQGMRRIGDIARVNVIAAVLNTLVAIALYAWLGQAGIVPVLVISAIVTLGVSFHYARRIDIKAVAMTWRETVKEASPLLRLGVALMGSALLVGGLDLFTRSLISRELGIEATGIYQAAWSLSGVFAAFILQAMGTDFYPRLTSVIHDQAVATATVNQQTEIGILLALPGLIATFAFAPWVIKLFYSQAFLPASEVLTWMTLGVFGRVISWPMGFIMLAMGSARWFLGTEAFFVVLQAGLTLWLVPSYGVVGAAYAFALSYCFYTIGMLCVSRVLNKFKWSVDVLWLLVAATLLVVSSILISLLAPEPWNWLSGSITVVCAMLVSARGLTRRLGPEHRISRTLARIPGHHWIVGP